MTGFSLCAVGFPDPTAAEWTESHPVRAPGQDHDFHNIGSPAGLQSSPYLFKIFLDCQPGCAKFQAQYLAFNIGRDTGTYLLDDVCPLSHKFDSGRFRLNRSS